MIPGAPPGIERLVRGLGEARARAGRPDLAALVPRRPGIYAWWADASGRVMLTEALGQPLSDLIYAGQAGADSSRAAAPSSATLHSRILGNHLGGQIGTSTFRRTLCAVLLDTLALRPVTPKRLDARSSSALTHWMRDHLSVGWVAIDAAAILGGIEGDLLRHLDPPLNLQGMTPTPLRASVRRRRRALGAKAP